MYERIFRKSSTFSSGSNIPTMLPGTKCDFNALSQPLHASLADVSSNLIFQLMLTDDQNGSGYGGVISLR